MKSRLLEKMNIQLFSDDEKQNESGSVEKEKNLDLEQLEENKDRDEEQNKEKDEEGKKYTDREVNEIINKKYAEWKSKTQREVKEAEKLARMNTEEKEAYRIRKMEEELESYRKKEAEENMVKVARGIFSEKGINLSDELIKNIITEDAKSTKENVEKFYDKFIEEVEREVNKRLKGKTPTKPTKKSVIDNNKKLIDMTYKEQVELRENNPELYKKLLSLN